jgi:hypothetical protein
MIMNRLLTDAKNMCKKEGYRKSKRKAGCKFDYLIDKEEKTTIEFEEMSNGIVKAFIKLKRNDLIILLEF